MRLSTLLLATVSKELVEAVPVSRPCRTESRQLSQSLLGLSARNPLGPLTEPPISSVLVEQRTAGMNVGSEMKCCPEWTDEMKPRSISNCQRVFIIRPRFGLRSNIVRQCGGFRQSFVGVASK